MPYMVVTLEVSKLSGWSNTDAPANIWYMLVTLEVSKRSGWLNADALWNMWRVFVTLEVSKLSGWLNADATCAESQKEGIRCGARCRVLEGRRRRATAVHAARRGGLECRFGAGHGEERT